MRTHTLTPRAPDLVDQVENVLRSPGQPLDAGTRSFLESRFAPDFSGVARPPMGMQRKLAIAPAGDAREQQADRVAAGVMSMRPDSARPHRQPDFSHVRVHADGVASQSARAAGALAYTVGSHIVFRADRYAPGTAAGRQLLAHELAHVTQQAPGVLHRKPAAAATPLPVEDQIPSTYTSKKKAPDVSALIHFSTLSVALDAQDNQVVEAVIAEASDLAVLNEIDFIVEGHADERPVYGDLAGNQGLAKKRAQATKASMLAQIAALPSGLPKKALERGNTTATAVTSPEPPASLAYQRRAEIQIVVHPNLEQRRLIAWDPDTPELVTVTGVGVTPRRLAVELYGDEAFVPAISFTWDTATQGKLWFDTELPIFQRARIEYSHLRPRKQSLYDRTVTIASRSSWGARAAITGDPKRSYEPYTGKVEDILDSIVVHHSGNSNMHTMKEVQDQHLDEKERADIAYHYGIDLAGKVYEGRPIQIKGAHVAGANTGKIGIVLLADLDTGYLDDDDDLTSAMESSLLRFIHYLRGKYPRIQFLGGHMEFAAGQGDERSCPGDLTMAKMNGWRSSTTLVGPT